MSTWTHPGLRSLGESEVGGNQKSKSPQQNTKHHTSATYEPSPSPAAVKATHTHSQSATLLTSKELQRLWLNWYQHIVSYGLTRQQEAVWCGAVLRALLTLCVDALGLRGLKFSSPSALDMIFTLSAASILLLSMSFFILRFSS